jgi:hypothetical protein
VKCQLPRSLASRMIKSSRLTSASALSGCWARACPAVGNMTALSRSADAIVVVALVDLAFHIGAGHTRHLRLSSAGWPACPRGSGCC